MENKAANTINNESIERAATTAGRFFFFSSSLLNNRLNGCAKNVNTPASITYTKTGVAKYPTIAKTAKTNKVCMEKILFILCDTNIGLIIIKDT